LYLVLPQDIERSLLQKATSHQIHSLLSFENPI
jgi:hypothetical protein